LEINKFEDREEELGEITDISTRKKEKIKIHFTIYKDIVKFHKFNNFHNDASYLLFLLKNGISINTLDISTDFIRHAYNIGITLELRNRADIKLFYTELLAFEVSKRILDIKTIGGIEIVYDSLEYADKLDFLNNQIEKSFSKIYKLTSKKEYDFIKSVYEALSEESKKKLDYGK